MHTVEPIRWTDKGVVLLDQRRLPGEVVYVTYTDYRDLAQAARHKIGSGFADGRQIPRRPRELVSCSVRLQADPTVHEVRLKPDTTCD